MPIEYKKGDATDTSAATPHKPLIIAHVCNNTGAWGAGFTGAVDKAFGPRPQQVYRTWWDQHRLANPPLLPYRPGEFTPPRFVLGETQLVLPRHDVYVANMVAQSGLYSATNPVPLHYHSLQLCLRSLSHLADLVAGSEGVTLQMPRIGTGLARGKWDEVELLLQAELMNHEVVIVDLPKGGP